MKGFQIVVLNGDLYILKDTEVKELAELLDELKEAENTNHVIVSEKKKMYNDFLSQMQQKRKVLQFGTPVFMTE